jgi:ATP-binding cassette subfamily B (MDR/TAP) protein 1
MTTRSSPASSSHVAIDDEKHHAVPVEARAASPMAGLSEQEKEIIQRQIDAPKLTVGYFALFRYANWAELAIMFVAVIASIVAGAVMPLMTVRFEQSFPIRVVGLVERNRCGCGGLRVAI